MSDVFTRPPGGVGADTGACTLLVPAHAPEGEELPLRCVQHSVLMFENAAGRRAGPLLLTVNVDNSDLFESPASENVTQLQSVPMASRVGGYDCFGVNAYIWGSGQTLLGVAGSLVIDIQVGSVRRTLIADLVSGTYQLPACDSVMVSAAARRVYGESSDRERRIVVQGAVTPGWNPKAQDLIYSDLASYVFAPIPAGSSVRRIHTFWAPEGAKDARLVGTLVAPFAFEPFDAEAFGCDFEMGFGAATYTGTTDQAVLAPQLMGREWLDVSGGIRRVGAGWIFTNVNEDEEVAFTMVVGAQWKVDL